MDNPQKIILDLCGGTGSWSKPYLDKGYTVYNITLPLYDLLRASISKYLIYFPSEVEGVESIVVKPQEIYGILAAPVCTMFSIARTRAKTPRDFYEGMELVRACMNIIWECRSHPESNLKFWALENPVGFLRQFLGKPVFTFDPCDFGEPWTKKTDLWGYFNIPTKNR